MVVVCCDPEWATAVAEFFWKVMVRMNGVGIGMFFGDAIGCPEVCPRQTPIIYDNIFFNNKVVFLSL